MRAFDFWQVAAMNHACFDYLRLDRCMRIFRSTVLVEIEKNIYDGVVDFASISHELVANTVPFDVMTEERNRSFVVLNPQSLELNRIVSDLFDAAGPLHGVNMRILLTSGGIRSRKSQ